jgi:hypothetical protein
VTFCLCDGSSAASATPRSTPTPLSAGAFDQFANANDYLDLTALGRQEKGEEPQGRATPLGLNAGGPAMRLADEYEDTRA